MTPVQKEEALRRLFDQWMKGDNDRQTLHRLVSYADDPVLAGAWQALLEEVPVPMPVDDEHAVMIEKVYQRLTTTIPELQQRKAIRRLPAWTKYAAAAAILFLAGGLGYYILTNHLPNGSPAITSAPGANNVVPLHTRQASLTLANGASIALDSITTGTLAHQNGAVVLKSGQGRLAYRQTPPENTPTSKPAYNTLRTPKGSDYQLVLSDGTHVWLNAASSITFPVAFTGNTREVSITGEAYFEVSGNAAAPFRVKVNDAVIEVLGTHFNISAYTEDHTVTATLLEGAVRVVKGDNKLLLRPGQQALFSSGNDAIRLIPHAEEEAAVAWKNGVFDFRNQDIETVMNQIGRWYNMEIIYDGAKPQAPIIGMMSRSTDLVTALKSLELTSGIHFRIEAGQHNETGKIIVQP